MLKTSGRREPSQLDRKNIDEHWTDNEARQADAKSWILKFDSKKQKLPFFNYDKFVSRYNWQIGNDIGNKQWIQPSRNKMVESVIRWLEINN